MLDAMPCYKPLATNTQYRPACRTDFYTTRVRVLPRSLNKVKAIAPLSGSVDSIHCGSRLRLHLHVSRYSLLAHYAYQFL